MALFPQYNFDSYPLGYRLRAAIPILTTQKTKRTAQCAVRFLVSWRRLLAGYKLLLHGGNFT
jgi:hypothetical protein